MSARYMRSCTPRHVPGLGEPRPPRRSSVPGAGWPAGWTGWTCWAGRGAGAGAGRGAGLLLPGQPVVAAVISIPRLVGEESTRVAQDFSCVALLSQGGPPAARGTGPFPRLAARVRCCAWTGCRKGRLCLSWTRSRKDPKKSKLLDQDSIPKTRPCASTSC